MKRLLIILLIVLGLIWAGMERRMLALKWYAFTEGTATPELLAQADEGPGVRWHDDYFTIEMLAPDTYAIGEPRYAQQNYSYLIVGTRRALLFDAGPGLRDIRAVAESLTDKPITFLPSHLHYDHVGNDVTFDRVALIDLPVIRERTQGNSFSPSDQQHLGFMEELEAPRWLVSEWITPGSTLALGGRSVEVYYTPGHTDDSISLFDVNNDFVFSGDYLYPGPLYGFLPNSSMGDYLRATEPLIENLSEDVVFYGAHRDAPPGAPTLEFEDLEALHEALLKMRDKQLDGEGYYPQTFRVNERLQLLAEPRWLQRWD